MKGRTLIDEIIELYSLTLIRGKAQWQTENLEPKVGLTSYQAVNANTNLSGESPGGPPVHTLVPECPINFYQTLDREEFERTKDRVLPSRKFCENIPNSLKHEKK